MNAIKNSKGITLIALVITIIVLLILAGISISTLVGDSGILKKADKAKVVTIIGEEKEIIKLAYSSCKLKNAESKELVTIEQLSEEINHQKKAVLEEVDSIPEDGMIVENLVTEGTICKVTMTYEYYIYLPNYTLPSEKKIFKIFVENEDGEQLAGSIIQICTDKECTNVVREVTTDTFIDENGVECIGYNGSSDILPIGIYYLKFVQASAGYNIPTLELKYEITNSSVNVWTVTLTTGAVLPSTGGPIEASYSGEIVDTDEIVTISVKEDAVKINHENVILEGVTLKFYKIADINLENEKYTLVYTSEFESYFENDEIYNDWDEWNKKLGVIEERDNIQPNFVFTPGSSGEISSGLYHIIPTSEIETSNEKYQIIGSDGSAYGGVLTCTVPYSNLTINAINYSKVETPEIPETKSLSTLVVWDDEGYEDERPVSIDVSLLRDGADYERVTLKASNNWRYTWDNLSTTYEWQFLPVDVDGYTTSIEKIGNTTTITYTRNADDISPDEPPL